LWYHKIRRCNLQLGTPVISYPSFCPGDDGINVAGSRVRGARRKEKKLKGKGLRMTTSRVNVLTRNIKAFIRSTQPACKVRGGKGFRSPVLRHVGQISDGDGGPDLRVPVLNGEACGPCGPRVPCLWAPSHGHGGRAAARYRLPSGPGRRWWA
jgi:hypothetical protein